MIRVLVVDDHAVVRDGLELLLERFDSVTCVGAAADGAKAVALADELRPDVVLMDLSMPVLDGIEATRRIVAADPEVAVVVLTTFADDRHVMAAVDAGAVGYLLKDSGPDQLLAGVEAAARYCFARPAEGLNRSQAALIAVTLPAPRRYSCRKPGSFTQRRQQWVVRNMNNLGDVLDPEVRKRNREQEERRQRHGSRARTAAATNGK